MRTREQEIADLLDDEAEGVPSETAPNPSLAGVPVPAPGRGAPSTLFGPAAAPQLPAEDPNAIVEVILQRERARENLVDFARFLDPHYQAFPVHETICRELESIERGDTRRLAIFVPPATGKSRLASEFFPAWFFGRNPELEFIETSYDYDLAAQFGRNVRNLIKTPQFSLVFPGVDIAADASSMDEWKTNKEGEYKAEGVGGGLVGFHAHVAVIDDPVKSYAAVASQKARDDLWNWYTGVLLNRLRPYKGGPGAVILIMQRWHDDDLGGRVQSMTERGEEIWRIVSLPSLAEPGDPLGRAPGEALLPTGPNMRTVEELRQLQAKNPSLFMALHQQRPVADGGDIFQRDWLVHYQPEELPKKMATYVFTDYAMTESKGDYTVLIAVGVCPRGHVWLLDLWRSQCNIFDGVEQTLTMAKQWKALKIFIEKTAMAKAYGPILARRRAEVNVWSVLEEVSVIGLGGKESPERAGALAGAMQAGYVHLPVHAPWVGPLEYELTRFPSGEHDDQVDALSLMGLKLASLRKISAPKADFTGEGRGKVLPLTPMTFQDAVHANTCHRTGRRPRRRWLVAAGR